MVYVLVGLLSRPDDFRVPDLVGAGADLGFFCLVRGVEFGGTAGAVFLVLLDCL